VCVCVCVCVSQASIRTAVARSRRILDQELDSGNANEIMTAVELQRSRLDFEFFAPQLSEVQKYLAEPGAYIKDNQFAPQPLPQYETLCTELLGSRNTLTKVQIGSDPIPVLWVGPFCSAKDGNGFVVGTFGVPEAIKVIDQDLTRPGEKPVVVCTIDAAGWNVKDGCACDGLDAALTVAPQREDRPLWKKVPPALRQAYEGRMIYNNGDEYSGSWSHGRRHGTGRQRYIDHSVYEGDWTNDLPHGHGIFTSGDASKFIFHGTFDKGKKHGPGKVFDANSTDGQPLVEGMWINDVFVLPGPIKYDRAWNTVSGLPQSLRELWRGNRIMYVALAKGLLHWKQHHYRAAH